jgi:hypothetical protein
MRRVYILKQDYKKLPLILLTSQSNKYFKHLLSRSAQVHCLASVLLANSLAVILWLKQAFCTGRRLYVVQFIFIDEAWLLSSRYINIQNSRICSVEHPHVMHDNPLY